MGASRGSLAHRNFGGPAATGGPRLKLSGKFKKALVFGLSLFATSGAAAVEEMSKQVYHSGCSCDVWEVCCSLDCGLTQACLDAGLRAERYTIDDMRKRSTGVA